MAIVQGGSRTESTPCGRVTAIVRRCLPGRPDLAQDTAAVRAARQSECQGACAVGSLGCVETGSMTPEVDLSSEPRRRAAEWTSWSRPVEISLVAIVVMDADQRVTGWNPAASQLFGYSPQEAIGRLIDDLGPQRGPPRRRQRRHARGGFGERSCRPHHSSRAEDGKLVDVQMMLVPLRVEGGARRLLRDLPRHHRAPARTRARWRRSWPSRRCSARC